MTTRPRRTYTDDFRSYYGLEGYTLKDIDRYLWQLGKEKLPLTMFTRR
ncbi:hypothetical protein [uncultured Trichococcus sp.]|nr:hypothetical protein [uncultured Trichococcus sp.]